MLCTRKVKTQSNSTPALSPNCCETTGVSFSYHLYFACYGYSLTELMFWLTLSCFPPPPHSSLRSHAAILKIPNEEFYDNELQVFADQWDREAYCNWEYLPKKVFNLSKLKLSEYWLLNTDEEANHSDVCMHVFLTNCSLFTDSLNETAPILHVNIL